MEGVYCKSSDKDTPTGLQLHASSRMRIARVHYAGKFQSQVNQVTTVLLLVHKILN